MTWSAPMTAVAGATFSAAQFNQFVRDNLNETGPAKVSASGQILVSTGANALAARSPSSASVIATETTATTTYTNLSTTGPAVTVTTGTRAFVFAGARLWNNNASFSAVASVDVSGASSVAAGDDWSLSNLSVNYIHASIGHLFTGLTAGSNIFTMKYRTTNAAGTANFASRELLVIPL
jgi:hypothetical protein